MIRDFLCFLINPKNIRLDKISMIEIALCFLFLGFSYFVISIIFSTLIFYFDIKISFNSVVNKLFNENRALLIIFIAPVSEELLFRSILRPSKASFSLFSFAILVYLLQFLGVTIYLNIILSFFSSVAIYKIGVNVNFIIREYFVVILYSSCLLFALIHFFNYELNNFLIIALPFLLIPKIYLALSLCFLRIRYGFISCIVFHSLINALLVSVNILK